MVTKANSFVSSRGSLFVAMAAAATVLGLGSVTQGTTIYTYTPTNASTTWSSGTDWSAIPVSGSTTTLTFGASTPALASGLTNTNTDDISGGFQANIINLQGTGPTSGSAATINIAVASGSYLNMVNNGTASNNNPVINLNANAGSGAGLTYNVLAPITVSTSAASPTLTFSNTTGNGTAAFNFSGGITANAAGFNDRVQGTVTLSGSATNTFEGGFGLSPGAPGALNLNANVNVTGAKTGGFSVGYDGTVTQGNNAIVNLGTIDSTTNYANAALIGVGYSGMTGTYTLNSGMLNVNVQQPYGGLRVGVSSGVTGVLNVNGGTLNNYVENSTTPTADALGVLSVSTVASSTSTVNQTGGTVNTGSVELVGSATTTAPSTATYNLDGGTLATVGVYAGVSTANGGTSVFNFNGGTLQAIAAQATHVNGQPVYRLLYGNLTAANVQNGGAIIDTNGFNSEVDQALLHDSSLGSTPDGGLTVKDSSSTPSTLFLTGANTYTGATTVAGGTLTLGAYGTIFGSLANSNITIDSGATFNGTAPGSGKVSKLNFNISGDTSNLITDNGTFNITDLALALNLSGTQTLSQYVLADYTNGNPLGSKFYSTTLANGWSINYGTLHPGEIVLVNANAVPEPASLGLLAVGGLGLLLLGKRRHA